MYIVFDSFYEILFITFDLNYIFSKNIIVEVVFLAFPSLRQLNCLGRAVVSRCGKIWRHTRQQGVARVAWMVWAKAGALTSNARPCKDVGILTDIKRTGFKYFY